MLDRLEPFRIDCTDAGETQYDVYAHNLPLCIKEFDRIPDFITDPSNSPVLDIGGRVKSFFWVFFIFF